MQYIIIMFYITKCLTSNTRAMIQILITSCELEAKILFYGKNSLDSTLYNLYKNR